MAGIIAGALHGLGGQMVNIGNKFLDAQIEETKATRLLELQAQYRREDAKTQHGYRLAESEAAAALADKPRQSVLAEANKPVPFRNVDEAGDVYDDQFVDKSNKRRGLIASELGYTKLADDYKKLDEPGMVEQERIKREGEAARDERLSKQKIQEKQAEDSPSQVRLRDATADAQGANASRLRSDPDRQDRRESRDAAREMINGAARTLNEINNEAKLLDAKIDATTGDEKAVHMRERKLLEGRRQKAVKAQETGTAMLQRLESGGGSGAAPGGGASPPSAQRGVQGLRDEFGDPSKAAKTPASTVKPQTDKPKATAELTPRGFTPEQEAILNAQGNPSMMRKLQEDALRKKQDEASAATRRYREMTGNR